MPPAPADRGSPAQLQGPTLAISVGRPFFEVLANRGLLPAWVSRSLLQSRPDDRLPLQAALAMLDDAVAISGDPEIGLHAALRYSIDAPLLKYVAVSSATVRQSLETIARYIMAFNDGLEIIVRVEGIRAMLEFRDRVKMNRAALDFAVAAFYLRRMHWIVSNSGKPMRIEAWFRYPEPKDRGVHTEVFGAVQLRFDAPLYALVFPAERLDRPMDRSDPVLHKLLLRAMQDRLAPLPPRLTQQTRGVLSRDLQSATAKLVATRLSVSERTLARRLGEEGTSFKILVDEARCVRAVRHLLRDRLSVKETAWRLGFSESAAFYKAFRRWFGTTPSEYLRSSCGS